MQIILRARLDSIRLPSLLQVFVMEQSSVTLEIDTSSCRGQVSLSQGQFSSARWDSLTGRDAILEMAMLTEGDCRVFSGTCVVGPLTTDLAIDPMMLLLEALRIQDQWQDLAPWLLRTEVPSSTEWTPFEERLLEGFSLEEARQSVKMSVVKAFRQAEMMLERGSWLRSRRRRQSDPPPVAKTLPSRGLELTPSNVSPEMLKRRHDLGLALIALWQSHSQEALWMLDDLVGDNPADIALKYRWLATRGRLDDLHSRAS